MSGYLSIDELSAALRSYGLAPSSTTSVPSPTTPTTSPESESRSLQPKASKETKQDSNSRSEQKDVVTAKVEEKAYDRWTLKPESDIEYGYFARTGGKGIQEARTGFYLTTAINYTNGPAHMGHAYEATTSDVISRYNRLLGTGPTFFLTGSDEHGQKIANTAAEQNKEPIEICDLYVTGFQVLNQRMLISNDDYVRTTSDRHKRVVHEMWKRCDAAGDIYLDKYSGWYNVREENFVTDSEAALSDFKDPASGLPLRRVEEESYFFKMSKYKDRLIQHIEDNPDFIRPDAHRNQILYRLKSDDLRDLSISRTTFSWGIAVPEGFEAKHVIYVWLDALSNYLTGVNGLRVADDGNTEGLDNFWPCDVHIIGKDILWFHTVIWPCLLMSAGIPLPKCVFAHGFVNDKEGRKMSKSLGNVVDPHDMLDKYAVDTFRWYLCKEAPYGGELSFSEENMRDMHNADLCDTLGNLVHRATNLCQKYCEGMVPDVPPPTKPPVDLAEIVAAYSEKMSRFELQSGASIVIQGFRDVNGYLQEEAPWAKKGDEFEEHRKIVVRACLEAIYALAHLLLPFTPVGTAKIFEKLGTEPVSLTALNKEYGNLKVGTKVQVGDVLYQKAFSEEEIKDAEAAALKKKESFAEAQKRKKEAKMKAISAQQSDEAGQPDFTKIDIRVGKIMKVWHHESAEKLFCEQIDVGEATGFRNIASGLRDHYTVDDMEGRKVLVVCNLKPAKMLGFESNGMVLAAKSADGSTVELVDPPADAPVGERVYIEGLGGEPLTAAQVKKKKVWETVAKDLKVGEGNIATWNGQPILTSAGPCKVASLVGALIS